MTWKCYKSSLSNPTGCVDHRTMSLSNPWIWCIASLGIGSNYQHFLNDIFDAKFVNDKGKKDGIGVVLPHCRGSGHRGKTELGEVRFESVVGDAAGLLEAGHAFSDI